MEMDNHRRVCRCLRVDVFLTIHKCTGIDADVVLKVSSKPANSEQCRGVLAGAFAYLVEDATLRPVYGLVELCQIIPDDFAGDLSTTVHEVFHALVRTPTFSQGAIFNKEILHQ